jgi:predicted transposase YdaD
MVGITKELRESRFYRDIKEEGKNELLAEAIPMLLEAGWAIEEIADRLKTSIAQVRQLSQPQN